MSAGAADVALEVRQVSKTFGTVEALRDVDLRVRRGSVHGLVGENGSGKSTLTKIVAGVVAPDAGEVLVDGAPIETASPRGSLHHGIRTIYQDLALFRNLSVAENLTFSGDAPLRRRVNWRAMRKRASDALAALDLELDPNERVGDLPASERQLVAIARAVSSEGRIILMDEPTAALTQTEIDRLLETIAALRERGLSFVFISHKLREVVAVSDEVTVLRNGEVVANDQAEAFDQDRIGYLMTGGVVHEQDRDAPARSEAPAVLEVRGLTLPGVFEDVDITLRQGRVTGLAGVVGSGRSEIGLALTGLIRPARGELLFKGQRTRAARTLRSVQYVPEDRLSEGLLLEWPIAHNIVANSLDSIAGRSGFIDPDEIHDLGDQWRQRLSIKAPSVDDPVATLSGGNQQRVLLARALAPEPEVVVLNNPTVGVDIGSRADIHRRISAVAAEGTAVLLISDEPAELLSVCDEILIVREGRIEERLDAHGLDEETLWDLIASKEEAT